MKKVVTWIIITLGISILSILIYLSLLQFFKQIKIHSEVDAWIGFIGNVVGAIMSGVITFFVFYATMHRNRKIEDKRKIEDIRPFIIMEKKNERVIVGGVSKIKEYMCIKNIGLNSAVNITCDKDILLSEKFIKSFFGDTVNNEYLIGSLSINSYIEFDFKIFKDSFLQNESNDFTFFYSDLRYYQYRQKIYLTDKGFALHQSIPELLKEKIGKST